MVTNLKNKIQVNKYNPKIFFQTQKGEKVSIPCGGIKNQFTELYCPFTNKSTGIRE